jgi:2OG-Fe(II) oxygenase superfamily
MQYEQNQKISVKVSHTLVLEDLVELLQGNLMALRIPYYYPLEPAEEISDTIIQQKNLERYLRAPDIGVQRSGITFFETNGDPEILEIYYEQAQNLIQKLRYTCSPYLSPIDKLRLDLTDMWLAGSAIENVHDRTMLAGIARVFEDGFELPPHQDILHRDILDSGIPPAYPFKDLKMQLSANIYLRTSEIGGELEIWNLKPSSSEQLHIRDSEYKYEGIISRENLPLATVVIRPKPGELILFDSGCIHAVRSCMGGPRTSMSMFVGYRGEDKPLVYWS